MMSTQIVWQSYVFSPHSLTKNGLTKIVFVVFFAEQSDARRHKSIPNDGLISQCFEIWRQDTIKFDLLEYETSLEKLTLKVLRYRFEDTLTSYCWPMSSSWRYNLILNNLTQNVWIFKVWYTSNWRIALNNSCNKTTTCNDDNVIKSQFTLHSAHFTPDVHSSVQLRFSRCVLQNKSNNTHIQYRC